MSNFIFLADEFPAIEKLGSLAESYLYTDPNTCLIKIGTMAETIVKLMLEFEGIQLDVRANHADKIKTLKYRGVLERDIEDIFHVLRKKRNVATHDGYDSFSDAKKLLEMSHVLACWFMECYGYYEYTATTYTMPLDPQKQSEANEKERLRLQEENEKLLAELKQAKLTPRPPTPERRSKAATNLKLTEAQSRLLIDEQLRKVGWTADSELIRYASGARPQKGKNLAIAEWPTDSKICKYGSVDYALFAGLVLVGVVEAKATHKNISAIIDNQCKDYSRGIKAEHDEYVLQDWNGYKAPFLFATNGREYKQQYEVKSGIWFRDARLESNISKPQKGWFSPQGLLELLEKDIQGANNALASTNYDLLIDKDGLNLRPYQIKAIQATEQAIIAGQTSILLAMATGTGKTRTILGMIYRLLKSDRFKRVLFLVDRTTLGEQAQDVFKEVKIEELMTLDEIYNIKNLEDKDAERETKVQVATVQSMVKRVLYNDTDTMPSVSDYDLIIIDEAHRGYTLDKDLSDEEELYRNQQDFVSKYRAVIDFFDAVKIALTATPALHTTEIFGRPVYEYSYRRAVIDGFLSDHDAPHIIETKLSTQGIKYNQGDTVAIYDPITGEITNSAELSDEIEFDLENFNRQVITESFNRTVLAEIAQNINPEDDSKTLIFAADDNHADMIVKILREIYEPSGISNDAVMKITGKIGEGNSKRISEAVKRFKNERYPNIAVTVDLLTTGIDVPEITNLVFMRRVRSRILFEQMLGRATRLCSKIGKTHFEIYDPVGVYQSLDPVSNMKPVVQSTTATFGDLITGLEVMEDEEQVKNQLDLLIAKIQRKKRSLTEKELEHFADISNLPDPTALVGQIAELPPMQAKEYVLANQDIFDFLNSCGGYNPRKQVVSHHEDELVSHTRGYGKGQSPGDYLDEFNDFINDNINKIAALKAVCTSPSTLTRETLKSLKLELDRNHFTEKQLNTAYNELKNEDIAADIIAYIRRYALGTALINTEDRIKRGVAKLRKNHNFTKIQLDWLARMEKTLVNEIIIDRTTFEDGNFKAQGGFERFNKMFDNKLEDYLKELNTYLYEDGGQTA